MSDLKVFIDESGDLGWKFDQPYNRGGSSRFLVISALFVAPENLKTIERIIKKLYWFTKKDFSQEELKGSDLSKKLKTYFSRESFKKKKAFQAKAIVIDKHHVYENLRKDPNVLYNYACKLAFIDTICEAQDPLVYADRKTQKTNAQYTFGDYFKSEYYSRHHGKNHIEVHIANSMEHLGLQFADIIAHLLFRYFQLEEKHFYAELTQFVEVKQLFFRS